MGAKTYDGGNCFGKLTSFDLHEWLIIHIIHFPIQIRARAELVLIVIDL